jgi:hypothetical protein
MSPEASTGPPAALAPAAGGRVAVGALHAPVLRGLFSRPTVAILSKRFRMWCTVAVVRGVRVIQLGASANDGLGGLWYRLGKLELVDRA